MVDTTVEVRQKHGWVEVVVRGVCAPPSCRSDADMRVELVGTRTLEINLHPGDPTACMRVQLPLDVTADGSRVKLRRKTRELTAAFLPVPTPTADATDSEGHRDIEEAMRVLSTGEVEPQQTPCERAVADARGNGERAVAAAAEALHTRRFTVLDDFVGNVPELLEEVARLQTVFDGRAAVAAVKPQAAGLYTAGRIGTHMAFEGERSVAAARGDQVVWIDAAGRRACPAADELLSAVDAFVLQGLVPRCTSPRLKGLQGRTDAMLACYPGGGAKYTKHIDNTARDGRRLSLVCYLNPDWKPAHGGCLRLHPMASSVLSKGVSLPRAEAAQARVVEVEPVAGRLVAFFADEMLHEVSQTFHPRHALTLWFYDGDERRRAAARRGPGEEVAVEASGGPSPPVDAGDAGDDALGEVMQLLQMLAQENASAPSREAIGRFAGRVRELTPHGQRVMAWLLELSDGELGARLEHLTADAFGTFVRGAARALGVMQS